MHRRWLRIALCATIATANTLQAHAHTQQHTPQPSPPLFLRPAVPEVPGAHSDLPFTVSGAAVAAADGGSSDAAAVSAGRWQWSYLDPTPALTSSDVDSFPYHYGVAEWDARDRDGGRFIPALRYAHVAVASDRALLVSHGYHYALSGGGATWLSDTWRFEFDSRRWMRLHDHIPHPAVGPVARYAAIGVLVGGDLFMHGGDDGGNAEKVPSYKHAIYGDLWRFILHRSSHHAHPMHTWVRVRSVVAASPFGIAAHVPAMLHPRMPRDDLYRSQHAAVMVPLGSKHQLHQADSEREREGGGGGGGSAGRHSPLTGPAPYLFVSHGLTTYPRDSDSASAAAAAAGGSGARTGDAPEYDVLDGDELFVFSFRTKVWRQVRTSAPPLPRFGHALVYVPHREGGESQAESWEEDQPRGSIFLYGGLSRSGVNHGDMWSLSLQSSVDTDGAVRPAFVWTLLHVSYPAGSSASPGRRGYHSFFYTPDHRLHLFGGARCEPGCVCSAESWLFDLQQYASRAAAWSAKLAAAKRNGISLSPPRPGSPDDPAACWSMLLPTSPHSPASRAYPDRSARGGPHAGLNSAEESIKAGWPVHRYKQSMSMKITQTQDERASRRASNTASDAKSSVAFSPPLLLPPPTAVTFSVYLFGGESYNPAAYFHDVWRFDYTHAVSGDSDSARDGRLSGDSDSGSDSARDERLSLAALDSFERLQRLLHLAPSPQFEWELPANERIEPQPFCVHAPPGPDGWGKPPAEPRRRRIRELAWRSASEIEDARAQGLDVDDSPDGGAAPVGVLSLRSSSSLPLVASLVVSLLLLLLLLLSLWRCFQRRAKSEKKG